MKALQQAITAAMFAVLPAIPAFASQGPGTTGGTATGLEQGLFVAVMVAATCAGLVVLRLKRG